MNAISEIHEYSTAEFLAREDEFSQNSLAPYLEQARLAIYGTDSGISDAMVTRVRRHRLLLEDKEAEFLVLRPDLEAEFTHANEHQIAMTTSSTNLDYFMEHGIGYEFDTEKLEYARGIAANVDDKTAMQALMREKLLTLSGFDGVSMNFMFHDVLDHAWLFNFMREQGLNQKYADFVTAAGNPFAGHLMSRESELLSGIGFTSRRFLSDETYYGSLAMKPENLVDLLHAQGARDSRVEEAADYVVGGERAAAWAGFVVKATVSNLILQRERWGGVKELVHTADGYKPTGNILSLTDPRYLALIVETTRLLAEHKDEYMTQEVGLTATAEDILQKFLDGGAAAGSVAIIQSIDLDDKNAMKKFGLSTNHFANNTNG